MNTQSTAAGSSLRFGSRWLNTGLHLAIVLVVVAGFLGVWWFDTVEDRVDDQQTFVLGRTRFAPGSEASVRVVVQDFAQGEPVAGAQVAVSLEPESGRAIPLYEGETDESGSLPVSFTVPADAPAEATLVVETRSEAGRDVVEQPVTIEREYRLLITSDKPLYQPGQTIHMRALALSTLDLSPARGAEVGFLVEDAKGNKVFRQSVTASEYGIAAADFTLADLVNQGDYKLSVSTGDTVSEKTVEVRPYVLPKFGVEVTTDQTYYLPGQRVEGVVQADYFFGKPVADGEVEVAGSVWDVERTVVVEIQGETDENGAYVFGFDLPDYFAGSGLESGQAQFALEVTVVDQTDHAEQVSRVLPVAEEPIIIEAVAESGVLKPGVENVVYVLTSYPDGRPAVTRLEVSVDGGDVVEIETGEYGLAQFTLTPGSGLHVVDVTARDEAGLAAKRRIDIEAEYGGDSVLLRADRAAYVVGETMELAALTPVDSGSIYLDVVKAGQTLSTRSAKVEDGQTAFAVDVSADLYGTIELHAYKVLLDGTIVRDTRVVMVDAPTEVGIEVSADAETYLPGETATIGVQTSDEAGAGLQTALGVSIVDESVFALQRQDPGFAKLYFMLEQELLEPFYQVKGFELPAAIPPDEQEVRLAQDTAARATWAGAPASAGQAINSRVVKLAAMEAGQQKGYTGIAVASALGLILAPVAVWVVVIIAVRRTGVAKRALMRGLAILGVALVISVCLTGWLIALDEMYYRFEVEWVFVTLAAALALSLLGFGIYAWVRRDPAAKVLALLTLAWIGLFALLVVVGNYPRYADVPEGLGIVALLAFLFVPGAYLLLGQARWQQQRRWGGGLATGVGVISALPALAVVPLLLLSVSMMGGVMDVPMAQLGDFDGAVAFESTATPASAGAWRDEGETTGGEDLPAGVEPPRLRQYFPETLYWAPEVVTDEGGFVSLEVDMADSITTWRLTALASSQDGRLGFTTRGVRVFQDFFVDIDLPVSLTEGDEISIPVGVFNYLADDQEVRLVVEQENWFELLGEGEQVLTIGSNDIDVVYFPIRVVDFGRQGFQVTAWGEQMSDAIRREVAVVPDGKEVWATESDWLRESKEVDIEIPAVAVPGTEYVEVKVYPGVMAQVVEGLEKILRLPHG